MRRRQNARPQRSESARITKEASPFREDASCPKPPRRLLHFDVVYTEERRYVQTVLTDVVGLDGEYHTRYLSQRRKVETGPRSEYLFPFGWGELWGVADRTDYDLTQHQNTSGKDLTYFDQEANEHYIPYVIEPSLGCDRVALAFLCEAYDEEHLTDSKGKEDIRTVLHLHPALAPYKCAVLPLSKKLGDKAMEIRNELSKYFMVDYDDTGSIGKRYRREDEIGTPYCITVDFDTVGDEAKGIAADNCVTVRDRDTMEQVRMPISELKAYIESKIEF